MPLKIEQAGARYTPDPAERAAFAARHWIRLPALIDGPLLQRIDAGLSGGFTETRHQGLATDSVDLRMIGAPVSELLVLLCNDSIVLRAIEEITGSSTRLTRFNGSIYRLLAGAGHQQDWHDDLLDGRRITLSINIGASTYSGGVLEIRDRATSETMARVPNVGRGDAVLFKLDRALEHRVTPVTSGVKTAFAGWFRHGRPLRDELRAGGIELQP